MRGHTGARPERACEGECIVSDNADVTGVKVCGACHCAPCGWERQRGIDAAEVAGEMVPVLTETARVLEGFTRAASPTVDHETVVHLLATAAYSLQLAGALSTGRACARCMSAADVVCRLLAARPG